MKRGQGVERLNKAVSRFYWRHSGHSSVSTLFSLSLSLSECVPFSRFSSLSSTRFLSLLSLSCLYTLSILLSPLLSSLSSSLLLSCSPDPFIILNRDAGQVMSVSRFFFFFFFSLLSFLSFCLFCPECISSCLLSLSSPLSSSALLLPFSAFSLCVCSLCPSTGLGYDVIYATGHVCSFFSQPEQASEDDSQHKRTM